MKSEMSEIKTNLKIKWREEGPALEDQKCVSDQDKQEVLLLGWVSQQVPTFLGEKTPRVPPSSRMATPISANKASLSILMASVLRSFSSQVSFSSAMIFSDS